MENIRSRRNQTPGIPLSPLLLRSKSGAPKISSSPLQDQILPLTSNSIRRSQSTTKNRIVNKDEENQVGNLRHNRKSDTSKKLIEKEKPNRTRSVSNSPSAWALSPGRNSSSPSPIWSTMDSSGSSNGSKTKSGGVIGVLKYFRSKKVNPVHEEAFHRYRVLYTRMVQWRVVNARAETVMAAQQSVAEKKLFNVWSRIFQLRNAVAAKRIQVQKLRHDIKLIRIINLEIHLLKDFAKIEKRNSEAVSKLSRVLSALTVRLPVIHGAKADTISVYKAMYMAIDVMSSLEDTITKLIPQVEETDLLLKELDKTVKQELESVEELRRTITMVASLQAQEVNLRVFLIQAAKEKVVAR